MYFNSLVSKVFVLLIVTTQILSIDNMVVSATENESNDSKTRIIKDVSELSPTKPSSQTRRSGGTRGECENQNNTITLIVPEDEKSLTNIPKSISYSPEFYWHMAQKSDLPVKFTLVETGKTLYVKEFAYLDSGLKGLTLPEDIILETGKRYRWTVSILCSDHHPSRNPYTEAWVEIVSLPSFLRGKGKLSCEDYEKAKIWYDTISCNLSSRSKSRFSKILTEVDLTDLAIFDFNLSNKELMFWSGSAKNRN